MSKTVSTEVSRDPSDYRTTEYFLRRYSRDQGPECETRQNPPISAKVIETCIREGDLIEAKDGLHTLTATVDGYTWWMVVSMYVIAVVPTRASTGRTPTASITKNSTCPIASAARASRLTSSGLRSIAWLIIGRRTPCVLFGSTPSRGSHRARRSRSRRPIPSQSFRVWCV